MAYRIDFTPQADEHLPGLTARERATIFDQLDRQLVPEPTVETRNRKRMEPARPGFIAPWELRVGHLRVYDDVSDDPARHHRPGHR